MLKILLLPIMMALTLAACAQVPSQQELAQYPVVTFGQTVAKDSPYILHFRAGQPIPITILIDGNLLHKPAKQTLRVTLSRDIYSYKRWASFDGKHWQDARKLLSIGLKVKIPSYAYPHNGSIHLSVNRASTK